MITDRVGKASRLTSSAGRGPESKPGRLTYFGILRGKVRGISIKRHSAFLEIVTRQAEHLANLEAYIRDNGPRR